MPQRPSSSSGKPNILAVCLSAISLAVICGSFDPVPAGEDVSLVRVSSRAERDVPLPPDARTDLAIDVAQSPAQAVTPASESMLLDSEDALKFSLLLLQDGARFVENIKTYSVVFHKQERLGGDLGVEQVIDLKVRHQPSFSVYMKWQNGDKGRQVLYNEEYEDGKMSVKLGGLKGRLIPAIKLDPKSSEAMKEARYPVTEAGLLGMLRQIIVHRQQDVKNGEGVTCRRLPNMICDERECYVFEFEYHAQRFNDKYRKSLVKIDCRYHVPLHVINHTWATDVEDLSVEELDELTLVENYSFTQMDFGREMIAQEFERTNPAYRM